ncbi:MAG TPA: hypothetical protein DCM87_15170 [Planctomycetes bacterium]|nr:hypothetical protein [Planctomycetota bacterium]
MESGVQTRPAFVRVRLSAMMFLEFFVWGGWGVAITGYAATLGFEGRHIGLLGAVPAIGAIVSPLFVGMIADRLFPAQRILCVLHVLGGICLILAGLQASFPGMLVCMMANGLCFMPTIALVNSVAFRHLPDQSKFPRIAVLGSIGWIVAVLCASVFLGGSLKPNFLFQSGVAGILMGIYCLTLPHTPPRGARGDVFGFGALKLLRETNFMVFVACTFLVSLAACGYFFTLQVPMLQQRGYPSPLALTSLNQFAEIIFMFSMPWFVARLGLKRVVAIGMTAWAVRYLCFSRPEFGAALIGLVLHGFCYSFFYVGSYMYFDRRAPVELKTSAQSLVTFLLVGVGMFVGSNAGGLMMEKFRAPAATMAAVHGVDASRDPRPLPPWDDPAAAASAWRYLDLSGTVKSLLYGEEPQAVAPDLGARLDTNRDGRISLSEVAAAPPEGLTFGGHAYSHADLVALVKKLAAAEDGTELPEDAIALTRGAWLRAQSCDWRPIWLWPSFGVMAMLIVFLIAFRQRPSEYVQTPPA